MDHYAALQKAVLFGSWRDGPTSQYFFAVRCHIRDCPPVYRMALAPLVGL